MKIQKPQVVITGKFYVKGIPALKKVSQPLKSLVLDFVPQGYILQVAELHSIIKEENKMERMLIKAEQIAREAHKGQARWNGEPYINHPMRVANQFENPDLKIVAWLHDVVEDCNVTQEDLIKQGIPYYLVNAILAMSKGKDENYFSLIKRIKANTIATKVKIADIKNNLNDNLKEGSLKDKYRLALYILEKEGKKK